MSEADRIETLPARPRPQLVAGGQVLAIVPRTIEEVFRLAQAVLTAGLAPDSYTKVRGVDLAPEKQIARVVIGIMKGAEVGYPPITALSTIAIINNRPCIYGDGATGLIQDRGHLDRMLVEEIGTRPTGASDTAAFADDFGVRVTMWRKGQSEPYIGEFTVADAKRAKLWLDPHREPWVKYPRRQLKWRAFAYPARDGFADDLMGLSIREEIEDITPEALAHTDTSFLDDAPRLPAPTEQPMPSPIPQQQASAEPVGEPAATPAPTRRRRRSKAEMEAARAAEQKSPIGPEEGELGPEDPYADPAIPPESPGGEGPSPILPSRQDSTPPQSGPVTVDPAPKPDDASATEPRSAEAMTSAGSASEAKTRQSDPAADRHSGPEMHSQANPAGDTGGAGGSPAPMDQSREAVPDAPRGNTAPAADPPKSLSIWQTAAQDGNYRLVLRQRELTSVGVTTLLDAIGSAPDAQRLSVFVRANDRNIQSLQLVNAAQAQRVRDAISRKLMELSDE